MRAAISALFRNESDTRERIKSKAIHELLDSTIACPVLGAL